LDSSGSAKRNRALKFFALHQLLSSLQQRDVEPRAVQDYLWFRADWDVVDRSCRLSAFANIDLALLGKIRNRTRNAQERIGVCAIIRHDHPNNSVASNFGVGRRPSVRDDDIVRASRASRYE
jgi:hypothetical protein